MTVNDGVDRAAERAKAGLPFRVGIVGLGASPNSWAESAHLPAIRVLPEFELRAVSASAARSARAGADRLGIPLAYETASDLAASDEVDLVVIAVRVPLHASAIE